MTSPFGRIEWVGFFRVGSEEKAPVGRPLGLRRLMARLDLLMLTADNTPAQRSRSTCDFYR